MKKYSTPTPKDMSHLMERIMNKKKSMPSRCTQYDTLNPPNKNKIHARRDYDKTRKGESSQSKIFNHNTKILITHNANNEESDQINAIRKHTTRHPDTAKHEQDARNTEL